MNDSSSNRTPSMILAILNLPKEDSNLSINGIGFRSTREILVVADLATDEIHMLCWKQRHAIFQHAEDLVVSYDANTEELYVVDDLTRDNFLRSYSSCPLPPESTTCISYHTLLQQRQKQSSIPKLNVHLLQRYCITHGTKVVPGTYSDDDDAILNDVEQTMVIDGIELDYPAVPVLDDPGVRHTTHWGTRQFLKKLNSHERTSLFRSDHPNQAALARILAFDYNDSLELVSSDLEFCFVLIQTIHCYGAWNHWRDLTILMLKAHHPLAETTLRSQLPAMEDMFEQDESSALAKALRQYPSSDPSWNAMVRKVLRHADQTEEYATDHNNSDDDDDPVVVEHVPDNLPPLQAVDHKLSLEYPILTAAVMETEDILMTCARALDEAKDVSLVREAAAYLEQVESYRKS